MTQPSSNGLCWCGEPIHTEANEKMKEQLPSNERAADADESPKAVCPTCHVTHVGPSALGLQQRLDALDRKRASSEPSDERIPHDQSETYPERRFATTQPPKVNASCEQQARDLLCRMGFDAVDMSAGELVELANLINDAPSQRTSEPPSDVHAKLREAQERISWAWSIIANVSGGDWSKQSQDWQDAAAQWEQIGDPYEGLASRDSTTVTKSPALTCGRHVGPGELCKLELQPYAGCPLHDRPAEGSAAGESVE
jgi:hypothetical protein